MRKVMIAVALGCLFIGTTGARWIEAWRYFQGDPPDALVSTVSLIRSFDEYLRGHLGIYTNFVWFGFFLLLLAAIWPQRWRAGRKARAVEFNAQFAHARQVEARTRIRDLCGEAYAKVRAKSEPPAFAEFLRQVQLPRPLPLTREGRLVEFVGWQDLLHGPKEQRLSEIIAEVFSNPACGKEIEAHRQTAGEFWAHWGDKIEAGEVKLSDIEQPVYSNRSDLKLLAFLELVSVERGQLSDGAGRRGLFYMARLADGLASRR